MKIPNILVLLCLSMSFPLFVSASVCELIDVSLSQDTIYKMKVEKIESGRRGELSKSDEIRSLSGPNSLESFPILNLDSFLEIDLSDKLVSPSDCIDIGGYFTVKIVLPGTYQLHFNTAEDMNKSFVRIEGYFEASSDQFFCSIFDYDDFRSWWEMEYGGWTLEVETTGLNFPGSILSPFQKNGPKDERCGHSDKFTELSAMEALLGNLFLQLSSENYYIIATNNDYSQGTIDHEIAHALYFIDEDYKNKSLSLLENLKLLIVNRPSEVQTAYELLEKIIGPDHLDYHSSVWSDEMQAFLSSNWKSLFCEGHEATFYPSELAIYFKTIIALQKNYTNSLSKFSQLGFDQINILQEPLTSNKCP